MKTTGKKLKTLKTRQVYGFKKELYSFWGNMETTTTVPTSTISHVMVNPAM
ncbi:hypothetical protein [Mucilaginibacter gotjawali]|uniref:Uncharacterized protein n=2 Tax=Mucilaginibacter gotjawali TaxID=1550579 RepID=A0A839SG42_9SPHI|nr:hypothetical protein [Mucilaginibacter gotjawali]MBB3056244.1 hypothetical protein [Mucilaginibacter gotjawali]BAU54948.1 hypothetical protein MgSA37_03128 [Mucilaginibacter gotjawali]